MTAVNTRKTAILMTAILLVSSAGIFLSGCPSAPPSSKSGGTAQWYAYDYEHAAKPAAGGSGKVRSFTMVETVTAGSLVEEFNIEAVYLGVSDEIIKVNKTVTDEKTKVENTTTQSVAVKCFKIWHACTVVRDDNDHGYPASANITLWIPVSGPVNLTAGYLDERPWARSEYSDSDGKSGLYSYYLTDDMRTEEAENRSYLDYSPYIEGDDGGDMTASVFMSLFSSSWDIFKIYAVGGGQVIKVGSTKMDIAGFSSTYSIARVTKTVGSYRFTAYEIVLRVKTSFSTTESRIIISPDLAIPIYVKMAASVGTAGSVTEFSLNRLSLE